jgi:protein-disulfide isomerase/uncharacterized protein YneF (UPF0154 family)
MEKEHFLVLGLVVGIALGVAGGYFVSSIGLQKSEIDEKVINNSLDYINKYLLQPGFKASLVNVSLYGENLYKLSLEFKRDNQVVGGSDVYLTKDGKMLILQSVDISKRPEVQRTEVSPDDDPYLGSDDAKVTIIEFSDYACPYCAKFEIQILPKILEKYGDKIKFVYRDFPLPFHGNKSILAAKAANCAGDQGKYWDMHDILFKRQTEWAELDGALEQRLYAYAEELNLNMNEFEACMESEKYDKEIRKDYIDGEKAGVTGTPTVFINGIKIVGARPVEEYYKIIDRELAST